MAQVTTGPTPAPRPQSSQGEGISLAEVRSVNWDLKFCAKS